MRQVRALYMEDSRTQHQALVTKIGCSEINKKLYNWIQLSETIFHPKGGGQPADEGIIGGVKVAYVHKEIPNKSHLDQFEISHCFEMEQPFPFKLGDQVELQVDGSIRQLHSRLHTAGHLLADAVNHCFPELEGFQGNHYPNSCYVKFKMRAPMQTENREVIKSQVEAKIASWIDQDLKVGSRLEPTGIRNVKVFQNWSPCGGTHVSRLKEIGRMEVGDLSINKKRGPSR